MSPPDLARNAPGLNVAHPFVIGVLPLLRNELGLALLHRGNRRAGQTLCIHEPLVHKPGLDDDARAVAIRHGHVVVFDLFQKTE